jgi:hypothetical protein
MNNPFLSRERAVAMRASMAANPALANSQERIFKAPDDFVWVGGV